MKLKFEIKTSEVVKEAGDKILKKIEKDVNKAGKDLGKGAYKQARKLASNLSKSLSGVYKENLYIEEVSENITIVGVREGADWIENGYAGGFMDHLLEQKSGSPVKRSKDGHRYRVIPFKHSTSGVKSVEQGGDVLVNDIKTFLRKKSVPYSKTRSLALDDKGSPRIGKIHSFNIKDMRIKTKKGVKDLSPNMQGLSVFQNLNKKTGKVERNIMTFRVISDKHKGSKWNRESKKGEKILEQVHKWIEDKWKNELLPALKDKYESKR